MFLSSKFSKTCARALLQSKQNARHQEWHIFPNQMEQLVYFAGSICSRPTTVGRRLSECPGQGWREKQHRATTLQPEKNLSKIFEEILYSTAKKGVGGTQLA